MFRQTESLRHASYSLFGARVMSWWNLLSLGGSGLARNCGAPRYYFQEWAGDGASDGASDGSSDGASGDKPLVRAAIFNSK